LQATVNALIDGSYFKAAVTPLLFRRQLRNEVAIAVGQKMSILESSVSVKNVLSLITITIGSIYNRLSQFTKNEPLRLIERLLSSMCEIVMERRTGRGRFEDPLRLLHKTDEPYMKDPESCPGHHKRENPESF